MENLRRWHDSLSEVCHSSEREGYDPASPLSTTPGIIFEAHVNDEAWQTVKTAIVAVTGTLGNKVRVIFDQIDVSRTSGRPAPKIAFVNSDGSQSET
jgi:hypothetical protein